SLDCVLHISFAETADSGIGTGLFVGTGSAYATSGPAGLLLAYIIVGAVLWCVMQSIAELATVVREHSHLLEIGTQY
ncbi:UNVERIFIED_CONTAM: gamma-aminobutyrate permease, partial [Bacteroidetes bacterium 56_B9]